MDDVEEFFGVGGRASNDVGGPGGHDALVGYQPAGAVVGEEGDAGRDCFFGIGLDAEGLQAAGELLDLVVEVGVGEFDFGLAVGVVEGDGLGKSLFDDRPNFGYGFNGTVIDQAAEVRAIAIGHLRQCVRRWVVHSYFL